MKYVSDFLTWFVSQYGKRPELSMEGSEAVKWDRERDIALKGWCAGRNAKRTNANTQLEAQLQSKLAEIFNLADSCLRGRARKTDAEILHEIVSLIKEEKS